MAGSLEEERQCDYRRGVRSSLQSMERGLRQPQRVKRPGLGKGAPACQDILTQVANGGSRPPSSEALSCAHLHCATHRRHGDEVRRKRRDRGGEVLCLPAAGRRERRVAEPRVLLP